jgi:hypothetical protein
MEVDREEIELNGAPGLVLRASGRAVLAVLIDTDGERIHSVFAVANPEKLAALAIRDGRRSEAETCDGLHGISLRLRARRPVR